MKAEIDQSGKIEQLNTHTVVALANSVNFAIYISSKEKIKLYKALRTAVLRRRDQNALVFATLVYLIIIKVGKRLDGVFIDIEYSGKNDFIKEVIVKISNKDSYKLLPDINFRLVGKSSKAHALGIDIYRKKDKTKAVVIKAEDVLKYIKF